MLPSENQIAAATAAFEKAFPAQFFVPLSAAAGFVGMAVQTARNNVSKGGLPFATAVENGRHLVPASELIRVAAERLASAGVEPDPAYFSKSVASCHNPEAVASCHNSPAKPAKLGRRRRVAKSEVAA